MRTVVVRGIEIGTGMPKICVPIIGETKENILAEAKQIEKLPVEMVEWRADWFTSIENVEKVMEILKELREILKEKPLLFTVRTKKEGGKKEISLRQYEELLYRVIRTGIVDLIDVELFLGDDVVERIVKAAHDAHVFVIVSNHDFKKTPEKKELVSRLCRMQKVGADIPKIAVMPECRKDVLTLLEATEEMTGEYADRPIITMSMGQEGVITRISGELFGSAVTFGTLGQESAPGQVKVDRLKTMLELLHERSKTC